MSLNWDDYVDTSENLDMHVFALPTSLVEKLQGFVPVAHKKAIVGEVTILAFLSSAPRKAVMALLQRMLDESIAFNYTYFNNKAERPDKQTVVRYHSDGTYAESQSMYAAPDVLEVVERLLADVFTGNGVKQLAYCYAANYDWENQEANGKMHQMRKLIGGL